MSEFSKNMCGVWVALVTPWDEITKTPDKNALAALIRRLFTANVTGLFVLGTTGEGFLFTPEERQTATEVIIDAVDGKLPVIVQIGHDNLKISMELAIHAQRVGAAGVASAPPARYLLDQDELETYFIGLAESVPNLPVLLYDIPSTSCNALSAEFLAKIHEKAPNIVGAKVSRSDWNAWKDYVELMDNFSILVGYDPLDLYLLLLGAAGIVSGLANVFPDPYVELYRCVKNEEFKNAVICQKIINKLCRILNYGQIALIKEALQELSSIKIGGGRFPWRTLESHERMRLKADLEALMAEWGNTHNTHKEQGGDIGNEVNYAHIGNKVNYACKQTKRR